MDQKLIIQITKDSIEDKLSFLDAIKKLRNTGVWGYRVEVSTHSKTIFDQNDSVTLKEKYELKVQRQFVKQQIVDALRLRQNGKTSYEEFMKQIAEAGVFDYIVDIPGKKVIYRGLFKNHEEKMPI